MKVVRPGRNVGFAGGCNLGARSALGDVIALVNQDAVVEPATLGRLAEAALRPGVAIATASIRLAHARSPQQRGQRGSLPGVRWSGSYDRPASARPVETDAVTASGAGMAMRHDLWDELDGFAEEYFVYHEDMELSMRFRQRGRRIVYVPGAIVTHRYEFSRNSRKYFLMERNRLVFCITLYETRTLLLLAPAFLCLELGMLAVAARGGWLREKLAGWRWIVSNRRWVAARRRRLQHERTRSDRALAPMLARRFDAGNLPLPQSRRPLDAVLGAYWAVVLRLL